jgi:hypothetical protein
VIDKPTKIVKKTTYYCSKCKSKVKESDVNCPKCKNLLATDGAIIRKEVDISSKPFNIKKEKSIDLKSWFSDPWNKALIATAFAVLITFLNRYPPNDKNIPFLLGRSLGEGLFWFVFFYFVFRGIKYIRDKRQGKKIILISK